MTENEKSKIDSLKRWLIVLTVISVPSWFISVDLSSDFSCHDSISIPGSVISIVLSPIMLYFSWKNWIEDKRGLSIRYSVFQVLVLVISLVTWFWIGLTKAFDWFC